MSWRDGGGGMQGKLKWPSDKYNTGPVQVNLMKHDSLDLIYNFML